MSDFCEFLDKECVKGYEVDAQGLYIRKSVLGEWAWSECLPRLLRWRDKELASEEFWRYFHRNESKQSKSRSAYALLTKIAVACLGEFEVRKRLEELK